nr:AbrB family transcriptional regulator [Actinomycetales bacterium]
MTENEKTPREGENTSSDEGVALSPYDSDLRAPEGEPDTGEFQLPTPAGYDDPEGGTPEHEAPAEAPVEAAPAAPEFQAPEWASFDGAPPAPPAPSPSAGTPPEAAPAPAAEEVGAREADEWAAAFDSATAGETGQTDFETRDHSPAVDAPAEVSHPAPVETAMGEIRADEDFAASAPTFDEPLVTDQAVAAPPAVAEEPTWEASAGEVQTVVAPVDEPTADSPARPDADATRAFPAGAAAVGAAAAAGAAAGAGTQPGVAAGNAVVSSTDPLEADPLSDTAVRRTSLIRPERSELPSNEPTALREATQADPRIDNYGTMVAPEDDALFEGARYDKVPSRVGAHIWGIVAMVLLIPVAWYLIADAGARMVLPENAQWATGTMNIAALAELVAGLVVLGAALLFARASSVGAFVAGGLLTLVGAVFVTVPGIARDLIEPAQEWLRGLHEGLGGNIAHHLEADGSTGRILTLGVILLLVGVISHSARRRGRDEQRIRAAVERRQARTSAEG